MALDAEARSRLLIAVLRVVLQTSFVLVVAFPALAAADFLISGSAGSLDSGGNTPLARALLGCVILLGAIAALLSPATPGLPRPVLITVVTFVAASGAAVAFSVAPGDSLPEWAPVLFAVLFLLVARAAAPSAGAALQAARLFLCVAVATSFVAFGVHSAAGHPADALTGTFYQADVMAGYLLLTVPLALGLTLGTDDPARRLLYGCVTVVLGANLLLTYSRGGQLAALVACGLIAVYALRWSFIRTSALTVSLLVLAVLLAAVVSSTGSAQIVPRRAIERASELGAGDSSVQARLAFYRGAVDMLRDRPLLGWGPGTFGRVFPRYQVDVRWYSKYAHSEYLAMASEGGLLTLGAFLATLGVLAWTLVSGLRGGAESAGDARPALAGIGASLLAVLLHLVVDVDWEFPMLTYTWFGLAGIGISLARPESAARSPGPLRYGFSVALLGCIVLCALPYLAYVESGVVRAARARNDLSLAEKAAAAAVSRNPWSSEYRRLHSETLMDLGAAPAAVEEARRAVSLDPERAVNHELLARALVETGDRAGAASAITEALARDPLNYPNFYNLRAHLYLLEGRPQDARKLLDTITRAYPRDVFERMWFFRRDAIRGQLADTWLLMARLDERDPARAAEDFRKALEVDPQNIGARFQLGSLLMSWRRPGDAWMQFREIHAMKPTHPISRWLLGVAYRELGQAARAAELMEQAQQAMPAIAELGRGGRVELPADFFQSPKPEADPRLESR